jgi:hypothetical protein
LQFEWVWLLSLEPERYVVAGQPASFRNFRRKYYRLGFPDRNWGRLSFWSLSHDWRLFGVQSTYYRN